MARKKIATVLILTVVCSVSLLAQKAPPSFKNFVAVGDSLSAGFRNLSLVTEGQNNSYPAFLARQLGTYHFLPLITEPGVPPELMLLDPGPPSVIVPDPGPQGTRRLPTIIPQNLAVPGQTTLDALTVKPDLPLDSLTDLILGVPSLAIPQLGIPPLSQLEMAFALRPTFTVLWLGSNEVLGAVLAGDPSQIVPFEVFMEAYPTAIGTIQATGSELVVANVPDPTIVAYLTSSDELSRLVGAPIDAIGPPLGINAGDFVTAVGLPLVPQILSGQVPGPLPDGVVLTAEEAIEVRTAVAQMNGFITQLSQIMGFAVVDVFETFNEIDQDGLQVGDHLLTTTFLGGLFSLDGLHPTNTGSALVANLFIEKINEVYAFPPGFGPQLVDLVEVANGDPLVPENIMVAGGEAPTLMSMDLGDWEQMISILVPEREGLEAFQSSGGGVRQLARGLIRLPSFRIEPGPALATESPRRSARPEPGSRGEPRLGGR